MDKKTMMSKALRTLRTVLIVILLLSMPTVLLFMLSSWVETHDRNKEIKEKKCWKKIYAVIEKSPKEKADWIKQTVTNRASLFGNADYCGTLKFIENGQEGK